MQFKVEEKREEIKEVFRKFFMQADDVKKLNDEIDKIIADINNLAVEWITPKDWNVLLDTPIEKVRICGANEKMIKLNYLNEVISKENFSERTKTEIVNGVNLLDYYLFLYRQ